MLRALILLGGPSKQSSFGPYDYPLPFFQVAGFELITHQLFALSRLDNLKDIFLLGFYELNVIKPFISKLQTYTSAPIVYLEEKEEMGTAGGIAFHLNSIFSNEIINIIVLHSDICSDFSLQEFYNFHLQNEKPCSIMTMKVSESQSSKFGCFIKDATTHELIHHAEKPENFISDLINCGIYLFNQSFKQIFETSLQKKQQTITEVLEKQPCLEFIKPSQELNKNYLSIEQDIIDGRKGVYLYQINTIKSFWLPIKNSNDILKANEFYLKSYEQDPSFSQKNSQYKFLANRVLIHQNAKISTKAKLGPNVVINSGCVIGDGVRISNSILFDGVEVKVSFILI